MAKKDDPSEAGQPQQTGEVDLTPHPLVDKSHADPDEVTVPPDVVSLVGYIGPSKRPDYTRLYQDLTFRNYYEIPTSGIVSTTSVNPDDENSPTHVQVSADTKVDVVTISVQSVEARLLSGTISSSYLSGAAGGAQTTGAQTLCTNITTYMPSCVAQAAGAAAPQGTPCFIVMTTMQCTLTQQAGAAQAGAQGLPCTNITTHVPSCIQPPCTNITTHVPSCIGQQCNPNCVATIVTSHGGPQPQAFAAAAGQICATFYTANPSGCPPGGTLCTNITTHMPSCVQPICVTVVTANPTDCGHQCHPYCIATIVTSGVGPTLCTNIATHMPSCIRPPLCTNITTHMPSCVAQQAGGPELAAQQACTNITTYMPSCVGQQCNPNCVATIVTSHADPQLQAQAQAAVHPTPPICITLYTHAPTFCPPQCHVVTHTAVIFCTNVHASAPNICTVAAQAAVAPQAQAAAPQAAAAYCITVYTHAPTFCPPRCNIIAHTAATLCTHIHPTILTETIICPTLYTAVPSGCERQCVPIANTAATLCTQHITAPTPGAGG